MIDPTIPYLAVRGSPEYPRFLITEPHGQVCSGTIWSPEEIEGLLFNDAEEAAAEAQDLLREQCVNKPHKAEYLVPILFEVMANAPVSLEALVGWLRKALVFELNYADNGIGPQADSCVLIGLEWCKIKNRKELK